MLFEYMDLLRVKVPRGSYSSSSFWGLPCRILIYKPQRGTTMEPMGTVDARNPAIP